MIDRLKGNGGAGKLYALLLAFLTAISPRLSTRVRYRVSKGYPLSLSSPKSLDEKISWLKVNVYRWSGLVAQCADKIRVRDYVVDMGCAHLLTRLYGIYDDVEDARRASFPDEFVLKWSGGSGGVVVCRDSTTFDFDAAFRALEDHAKLSAHSYSAEVQYTKSLNKLLCEELIGDNGESPTDYKFYCFEGRPAYILVSEGRGQGRPKFQFYDMEWNRVFGIRRADREAPASERIPRPALLEEAVAAAARLSAPFPFVRVDLYIEQDRVWFGELTFTPAGGVNSSLTREGDRLLGAELRWLFEARGEGK